MSDLQQCLGSILSKSNLILDEIQYQWLLDPSLIVKIIQIVDDLKPTTYRLYLIGTPLYGDKDIVFDDHTRGRLSVLYIPPFTPIENCAILFKLFPNFNVDNFLSLWSCFDGIPGLYELAVNECAVTNDYLKIDSLFKIIQNFVTLNNDERSWVSKIHPGNGLEVTEVDMQNPALLRLKMHGVITQIRNRIFVRDKVFNLYSILQNETMTQQERLNNMRGYGLESITKSIGKEILKKLSLEEEFEEVSLGYTNPDLDCVYQSKNSFAIFSCKVNSEAHNVNFFSNLESHFGIRQPPTIHLILCSPQQPSKFVVERFIQERKRNNLFWKPTLLIHAVGVFDVIVPLVSGVPFQKSSTTNKWPLIERPIFKQVKEFSHRIIHVQGFRRVGKTLSVKTIISDAVFLDLKTL